MSHATLPLVVPLVVLVSLIAGCGVAEDKAAPAPSAPTASEETASEPSRGAPTSGPAAPTAPAAPVADARGQKLYATHCAMCHGPTGKGDGSLAKALNPPPRGLVDEPWRYLDASTPESERATMIELVRKGKPDAAMPGLAGTVSEEDIARIVTHVLSLRGD